jgi:hypothetical protein
MLFHVIALYHEYHSSGTRTHPKPTSSPHLPREPPLLRIVTKQLPEQIPLPLPRPLLNFLRTSRSRTPTHHARLPMSHLLHGHHFRQIPPSPLILVFQHGCLTRLQGPAPHQRLDPEAAAIHSREGAVFARADAFLLGRPLQEGWGDVGGGGQVGEGVGFGGTGLWVVGRAHSGDRGGVI